MIQAELYRDCVCNEGSGAISSSWELNWPKLSIEDQVSFLVWGD